VLEQLLEKNKGNVKLVFKNYPLRSHPFAMKAAVAALAAGEQGKFWEFHDRLFKDYNRLSDQKILEIARELGLNEAEFEKDRKAPGLQGKIRQDVLEGRQAGVRGTPTVFINGKLLRRRTPQAFQEAVDRELKKIERK